MSSRPVLVIEHEAGAPVDWLGDWLTEAGAVLDVRRPYVGQPLPSTLGEYDGLVVLGGGMDAWDDEGFGWLAAARDLVAQADRSRVPTLGICLGFQLSVLALGGRVGRNPAGSAIAVLPVAWTAGAGTDPLFSSVTGAGLAAHWNRDVALSLPPGSTVVARTPDGAAQAVRLTEWVWGVQCHPEASPSTLRRWVEEDGAPYRAAGFDLDGFLADAEREELGLAATWRPLGRAFHALTRGASCDVRDDLHQNLPGSGMSAR